MRSLFTLLVAVVTMPTALAQELEVYGACPGPITVAIETDGPFERVSVLTGDAGGTTTVPAGPCRGRSIPLANAAFVTTLRSDASAQVTRTLTPPPATCGNDFVLFDGARCRVGFHVATFSSVPTCTEDFDAACPLAAPGGLCGGTVTAAGASCGVPANADCEVTGADALQVPAGGTLTLAFADDVEILRAFAASESNAAWSLDLLDAQGARVGGSQTNVGCSSGGAGMRDFTGSVPFRQAVFRAPAGVALWIDALEVNPTSPL